MSWTAYLHLRVDVIVCVADAIRRYFWNMKILGLSAPVKKAQTIYEVYDVNWYSDPDISLQEFNVPKDVLTIGCIANDRRRKGLKYFIAAIDLLPKDLSIYCIFIVDVKDKELLEPIKQSRYSESIHLLGVQKKAAAIIKSCDIGILPRGFQSLVRHIEYRRPVDDTHGRLKPNVRSLCQRHIPD
jgi:glycosyltransferase involved in cell wall biosynthesis